MIPLAAWFANRHQPAYLKPVIVYLWVALTINIACDVIAEYYEYLPPWLQYNPPFYNLHSVVRFGCFACFFIWLKPAYYAKIVNLLPPAFFFLVILNFLSRENFFYKDLISSDLLTAEAYFLLIFCLLYYLSHLKDEKDDLASGPHFWITTGLCVYVVINFFVFLFYGALAKSNVEADYQLAGTIWNVHNIAYILFSFFIAIAFYVSPRPNHRT